MQCPVCKAERAQGPQCRRCKADLSLLFDLEERRALALTEAKSQLVCGDRIRARSAAVVGHRLRSDAESRRLLVLAHLVNRNFQAAWQCYQHLPMA
jgi:hypothetical protein